MADRAYDDLREQVTDPARCWWREPEMRLHERLVADRQANADALKAWADDYEIHAVHAGPHQGRKERLAKKQRQLQLVGGLLVTTGRAA